MTIREEIRLETDWEKWIDDQGASTLKKRVPLVTLVVTKEDKPLEKLSLDHSKVFLGTHPSSHFKL